MDNRLYEFTMKLQKGAGDGNTVGGSTLGGTTIGDNPPLFRPVAATLAARSAPPPSATGTTGTTGTTAAVPGPATHSAGRASSPAGTRGAYVTCYACAPDPLLGIRRGIAAVRALQYVFEDLLGNVREIPLANWTEYIQRVWPEFVEHFPGQEVLPGLVIEGAVFFGPFSEFRHHNLNQLPAAEG